MIYIHCFDPFANKLINIVGCYNRWAFGNRKSQPKMNGVPDSWSQLRGDCIFVQQLFGNIIIAMKERASRKPNNAPHAFRQILGPSERQGDGLAPALVLNPPKQPHRPFGPSAVVAGRSSCSLRCVEAAPGGVGELLEIYEWRTQTDYPVVRASWRKVTVNHITFSHKHKQQLLAFLAQNAIRQPAAIFVEAEPTRPLATSRPLLISQFLYALREALTGFERLLSLFGGFLVSEEMVVVNAEGRVRAWLHPQMHLNSKIEGRQLEAADAEAPIVEQVVRIFQGMAQDSTTCRLFLEEAAQMRSFIGLLRHIHDFSQNRKIIIASKVHKKQETPANHPQRPLSPLIPFRPSSRVSKQPFNPHLSIAPNIALAGYSPQLALVSRKSVKEDFHFEALETTETLTPLRAKISNETISSGKEYGKIVKNRLNMWLISSKSQEQLPRFSPEPSIEKRLERNAPNSIEKCMDRLFAEQEEGGSGEYESKLMQLGRSVKASFIQ